MTAELRLFVYVMDLDIPTFHVIIECCKTVGELKKSIFDEIRGDLKDIPARLTLYKVELPEVENMGELAMNAPKDDVLNISSRILSKVFPVQPPEETVSILVEVRNMLREAREILDSALVKEYEDIFIRVKMWRAFGFSDIERNKIHKFQTVPDFVAKFEHQLDKKPGVAPNVCYFLSLTIFFMPKGQCRRWISSVV